MHCVRQSWAQAVLQCKSTGRYLGQHAASIKLQHGLCCSLYMTTQEHISVYLRRWEDVSLDLVFFRHGAQEQQYSDGIFIVMNMLLNNPKPAGGLHSTVFQLPLQYPSEHVPVSSSAKGCGRRQWSCASKLICNICYADVFLPCYKKYEE